MTTQHISGLLGAMSEGGEWEERTCSYCRTGVVRWPVWLAKFAPNPHTAMCQQCQQASLREGSEEALKLQLSRLDDERIASACEPLKAIADVQILEQFSAWVRSRQRANPRTGELDESDPHKGMLLHGPSGWGKTTQIKAIMKAWIRHTHSTAYYVTEREMYDQLMDYGDQEKKRRNTDRIMNAGLLVIDDIGTASGSAARADELFKVIDSRYRGPKRIIIATNLDPHGELWTAWHIDERIRRRIEDMCGRPVSMRQVWGKQQDGIPPKARGAA